MGKRFDSEERVMGIYLPNMEMPKNGEMLVIFPDGTSYVCFNGMRERLAQTKAVPVPPHGRLGDLDALAEYVHQQDDWLSETAIHIFCGILCKAPTIIPAEPEEEETK